MILYVFSATEPCESSNELRCSDGVCTNKIFFCDRSPGDCPDFYDEDETLCCGKWFVVEIWFISMRVKLSCEREAECYPFSIYSKRNIRKYGLKKPELSLHFLKGSGIDFQGRHRWSASQGGTCFVFLCWKYDFYLIFVGNRIIFFLAGALGMGGGRQHAP